MDKIIKELKTRIVELQADPYINRIKKAAIIKENKRVLKLLTKHI